MSHLEPDQRKINVQFSVTNLLESTGNYASPNLSQINFLLSGHMWSLKNNSWMCKIKVTLLSSSPFHLLKKHALWWTSMEHVLHKKHYLSNGWAQGSHWFSWKVVFLMTGLWKYCPLQSLKLFLYLHSFLFSEPRSLCLFSLQGQRSAPVPEAVRTIWPQG